MIFPAIDLYKGQSVRLYKGDYEKVTLIDNDPVAQAKKIFTKVPQLHLVDLNGAKTGSPENFEIIKQIRENFPGFIELGGGIRNYQTAQRYLKLGIDRIILGSAAIEDAALVKKLLAEFGSDRIVIGIDGKNGKVAVNGWIDQSQIKMTDLILEMSNFGAKSFIVTDVDRDGTMTGPNLDLLMSLSQRLPQINLVASGGVRDAKDLHQLKALGIKDVIIGKALYEKTITLEEIAEVENVS